jgi:hypothetical protein
MSNRHPNNFPKFHNAAWPGVVGKGEGSEPLIDLDTMLDLTAAAEVDGVKFDGFDLFLYALHINIDATDDELKMLAEPRSSRRLAAARPWTRARGRKKFLEQIRKGCRIARTLRELGIRPYGVVRIDSACGVGEWAADPDGNQKKIARTFKGGGQDRPRLRRAARGRRGDLLGRHALVADDGGPARTGRRARDDRLPGRQGPHAPLHPRRERAGGSHPPRELRLERQGDARLGAPDLDGRPGPWTIDFHVAQNDATVFGSGSHDHTGRHCLATDPNGKLDIPHHAGFWLRNESGRLTKKFRHICWDGCMFPNAVMMSPKPWNDILATMVAVRDAHGWRE